MNPTFLGDIVRVCDGHFKQNSDIFMKTIEKCLKSTERVLKETCGKTYIKASILQKFMFSIRAWVISHTPRGVSIQGASENATWVGSNSHDLILITNQLATE